MRQLRQVWAIVHDIYWRCRWGTGIPLPEGYLDAHDECETAIHAAQSGRQP